MNRRNDEETALTQSTTALQATVAQLGGYVGQMGKIMLQMQARMDEMEKRMANVSITHKEALRLQALIRMRSGQICDKYQLTDRDSPRIFRAAIKKDVLRRYGVRDLHDLPARDLDGAEGMIAGWVNIRLAMERRGQA